MKMLITRLGLLIMSVFIAPGIATAQLADGSIAPDFTFTDINGTTQHLYAYLDSGKYVALDISATWCHPCWLYHNTMTMDSLYTLHDNPGDKMWKIFFIEGDGGTNNADLNGTGTSTQGDWVTGTLYPIIDPPTGITLNDFSLGYAINYFPTLYLICPNRRIYQDTLNTGSKPTVERWEWLAANAACDAAGIEQLRNANEFSIAPNPARGRITLSFTLPHAAQGMLKISNMLGQTLTSKELGALTQGTQSLSYDLSTFAPGIYFITLSCGNNHAMHQKIVVE